MRNLLALGLVVVAGCGGDSGVLPGMDSSIGDLPAVFDLTTPHDLSAPQDLAVSYDFSGINCGPMTCSVGNVCCAVQSGTTATYPCATSCGDAGITITCDGPDNCKNGGNNICCGTLTTNGGTAPFCNISAVSACASSCTTALPASCAQDTGSVRLCHRSADCTGDSANPNCCLFTYNGNNITFCASATLMNFAAQCYQ